MKFFPLVWGSLWRKKARTIFTLLSVMVAFLLVYPGVEREVGRLHRLDGESNRGQQGPEHAEGIDPEQRGDGRLLIRGLDRVAQSVAARVPLLA